MTEYDYVIIGGGMAGASAGYFLAKSGRVLLLERESQLGYHTTGRSAALYSETYGNAQIRSLTTGSRNFFLNPPENFSEYPLLTPRGVLLIGSEAQRASVERLYQDGHKLVPSVTLIDRKKILEMVPIIRPEAAFMAVHEPDAMDIDVHGLLQGFLRGLRAQGGEVRTNTEVLHLTLDKDCWIIGTNNGEIKTSIVINAAGAWADKIAQLAGLPPVGLIPKRRTAITFSPPSDLKIDHWPSVHDADEQYYFKPDAGRLLASPADETPADPCDAQPEELDIAICIDRLQTGTTLDVRRIDSRWAGLRSFVMDKSPVIGFDSSYSGFFWLAGQGGYGIQTAPAMGRLAANLAAGKSAPTDLIDLGVEVMALSPARFR